MYIKTPWNLIPGCVYLLLIILLLCFPCAAQKTAFPIVTQTMKVSIIYDRKAPKLDSLTANLLAEDIERVTSYKPAVLTDVTKAKGNVIVIGTIESPLIQKFAAVQSAFSKKLNGKWECFGLTVIERPTPA